MQRVKYVLLGILFVAILIGIPQLVARKEQNAAYSDVYCRTLDEVNEPIREASNRMDALLLMINGKLECEDSISVEDREQEQWKMVIDIHLQLLEEAGMVPDGYADYIESVDELEIYKHLYKDAVFRKYEEEAYEIVLSSERAKLHMFVDDAKEHCYFVEMEWDDSFPDNEKITWDCENIRKFSTLFLVDIVRTSDKNDIDWLSDKTEWEIVNQDNQAVVYINGTDTGLYYEVTEDEHQIKCELVPQM